ncbi:MAG: glycosyltransferase family 2 protein [Bacteroidetes bacterium]|nr:glycosyltransferase family 2 protein [Bacteroidota bacterium]
MEISIICPVLNEEKYISKVINFFLNAPPADKELFLIDGGSTDGTLNIIAQYQKQYQNIRLLHNPKKFVSHGLNIAIPASKAEIISRIDAHCEYANDYFKEIQNTFRRTGADIVGGPTRTAYRGSIQEAVAYAICSPFAIGNSKVHDEEYEGFSDSVTFGAWKKDIFQKTGLFDTHLIRNQDDEFHYRAKSLGFTIYQNPRIKLFYYPRSSLSGLFKQYFQYGFYKPLVLRKISSETKLRHLIPSLFVLYMIILPLAIWHPVLLFPLMTYLVCDILISLGNKKRNLVKIILLIVFPTIHIAYGSGFILGLLKKSPTLNNNS